MNISASVFSHNENVKNFLDAEKYEKKIRDLLYAIDESSIVAFTDLSGKINYVNDKFCEISGYDREELLGQNHRIVSSGFHSKEFISELWATIKSGKIWKGEIKNKCKNGSYYWVFTTIIPILNERGRPREFLSIRYDITEKKRLEELNAENQKEMLEIQINKETSERFVSSLAHDMRTPLTSIKISAQIINKTENRETIDKLVQKILNNINRTDEMISDLLNANKIRAGHKINVPKEQCNANEIAQKTVDELISIHGQRFTLSCTGKGEGVWSPSGIKRIIENLCSNAVKYGDEKKLIDVVLETDEENLKITVHNWGEILKKDETRNLFDYLQRTKSAQASDKIGWGIGLTIVKGMAESHNGLVSVDSTAENGTTFTVLLPKQPASGHH